MSDQKKDHGHHAITREAVRQFFASGRATGDPPRIDGMTELDYYHALDAAQRDQDIVTPGTGEGVPTYGTSVPARVDGDAQHQHAMADPNLTGAQNLDANRRYVENQLAIAHEGGGRAEEMKHLGAAAHALEDSYSEAHALRGHAVDSGDPNAPVESINVWKPEPHVDDAGHFHGGKLGGEHEQGTHDQEFDEVPVAGNPSMDQPFAGPVPLVHGSDQAAAAATAQMLETYHDHRHGSMSEAVAADRETVGRFFQSPAGGTGVNTDESDPAYVAERERRKEQNRQEEAAMGVGHDGVPNQSLAPPAAPEPNASYQPAEPVSSEPNQSYAPPAEPNASYGPPPATSSEPNASYQPAEPNASYAPPADAGQSSQPAASSSEPNQSTEPNASYEPAQSSSE